MKIRIGQTWKSKRNGQAITIGQRVGDGKRWRFTVPSGKTHTMNTNRLLKWYRSDDDVVVPQKEEPSGSNA